MREETVAFCEVLPVLGELPIAVEQWTKLYFDKTAYGNDCNFLRVDKWNRWNKTIWVSVDDFDGSFFFSFEESRYILALK